MTSANFIPSTKPLPFELHPSSIQGTGAFAIRRIRKGTRIIEYLGERITQDEADVRYDDEGMGRHHTFLFNLDKRTVLDAGTIHNEARYINHSCAPNCQALIDKGHIYIYALTSIEPGEELVYDYGYERTPDMGPDAEALYVCRCGAPNCRGTILAPEKKAPARKKAASKSKAASKTQSKAVSKSKSRSKKDAGVKKAAGKKKSASGAGKAQKRAKSPSRKRAG
ncbi:SET domain protein [Myxococcus hansupus]|uniref:SET domain protein n=1 Tax=Pseudomyxococcus hansupus TaxID=1297742 RepID=A0A0H4WY71_9BACT|nr:SET domain-containing protein-lysine N-methyltransferase [Myxococcus hansupus]AKQ67754.1 SET domain protein [Myxococcus hansupus]